MGSKRSLPRTAAEWLEAVMNFIFFACGMLAVGSVVLITVYLIAAGVPAIGQIGLGDFLFGQEWASTAAEPKYGILPFILSSIWGTLGATLLGVPVGLLTAVFLSKAAGPVCGAWWSPPLSCCPASPAWCLACWVCRSWCRLWPGPLAGLRRLPAERHPGAGSYDPAQHRVRVGHCAERRPPSTSRAAWRWALPSRRPGSRSVPAAKAALPPASCWASAAPLAKPWPL